MVTLFGSTDSGHSYKVRLFLLLTQTAHEYRWVDLSLPPTERGESFAQSSKFGEVPVLLDDAYTLCQSNAILQYLAQKTQKLCGTTQADWLAIVECLAWEANRVGFSVPNLRFAMLWPHLSAQPQEVLAYLRRRVLVDLDTLDRALSKSEYLLPSGFSIADISCAAYLFWLDQMDVDVADYPQIARWLAAIRQQLHWSHPDEAMLMARAH